MRCKRWSCPHCRKINRMKVIHNARRGRPNVMMTLTVSSKNYPTPDDAAHDLRRGWVALRKRIGRKFPGLKVPFIAVFEKHKSGWPHMHLLLRMPYVDLKTLRAWWEEITGSWNVDVRFIKKSASYVEYICKYIGKDVEHFEGCKRWWRSHNYDIWEEEPLPPPPFGGKWDTYGFPFDKLKTNLAVLGIIVPDERADYVRWRSSKPIPTNALCTEAFTFGWCRKGD